MISTELKNTFSNNKFNVIHTLHLLIINTGCFIMYSGITKIWYRKTIGQVFTKPVQIEGTIKKFFLVSCFSSYFTSLPLGDASLCSEQMAALGEKLFCVLEYNTSKTVVAVQRAFCAQYTKYHCHVTSLT